MSVNQLSEPMMIALIGMAGTIIGILIGTLGLGWFQNRASAKTRAADVLHAEQDTASDIVDTALKLLDRVRSENKTLAEESAAAHENMTKILMSNAAKLKTLTHEFEQQLDTSFVEIKRLRDLLVLRDEDIRERDIGEKTLYYQVKANHDEPKWKPPSITGPLPTIARPVADDDTEKQ